MVSWPCIFEHAAQTCGAPIPNRLHAVFDTELHLTKVNFELAWPQPDRREQSDCACISRSDCNAESAEDGHI